MALLEHDLNGNSQRKLFASRNTQSERPDFAGKLLKELSSNSNTFLLTAKNTENLTTLQKADLQLSASTNQLTKKSFRTDKLHFVKAEKYYDSDKAIRKQEKRYYVNVIKETKRIIRLEKKQDKLLMRCQEKVLRGLVQYL